MKKFKKRKTVEKALYDSNPRLVKEWHPKNELLPSDVSGGSAQKVWWRCSVNPEHEWDARVYERNKKGQGCPFCSGRRVDSSRNLAVLNPILAQQFHPLKNGTLSIQEVAPGSSKKVWWRCSKDSRHEWEATLASRNSGNGCPFCSGHRVLPEESIAALYPALVDEWHKNKNEKVSPHEISGTHRRKVWWTCRKNPLHEWEATTATRIHSFVKGIDDCPVCTSLVVTHPKLAEQWHPEKNGSKKPVDFTAGSHETVWWKCPMGPDHEWKSIIRQRAEGAGCQVCNKRVAVPSNCLAVTHPLVAAEWDYEANKDLEVDPKTITEISRTRVSWKCVQNPSHKWSTTLRDRTVRNTKCPYCSNRKASVENSLSKTHPEIASQWHPTKNNNLTAEQVTKGSEVKVWWKCAVAQDHEWEAYVYSRTSGRSCPFCLNRKVAPSNCLAITHPDLAREWDDKKNHPLTPYDVTAGSCQKVHWKCDKASDHEWEVQINYRAIRGLDGQGKCPCCQGKKAVLSNCLATLRPDIAQEWDLSANSNTPEDVTPGSGQKVIWRCKNNSDHSWDATVTDRVNGHGCPYCNLVGWTVDKIRLFVRSLLPYLDSLPPYDLYVLFQQSGLLNLQHKSRSFIQALKTGKFPKEELEKFAANQPSLVDDFLADPKLSLDLADENLEAAQNCLSEEQLTEDGELPIVATKDVLAVLDSKLVSNFDKEAVEYFSKSAVAKIWKHAFLNESEAIQQLEQYASQGLYPEEVKRLFLYDYRGAQELEIPAGYSFPYQPNLMQRYTAYLVEARKRLGNWSGTGAGKTLSAVLASRVISARLTVICCPNNVIDNWARNINNIYPDSSVFIKKTSFKSDQKKNQYLILNYEFFQQPGAGAKLKGLVDSNIVDFVIIDEIHYSKQRQAERISDRKKAISAFLSEAAAKNPNLHVLGMSATPVINNLFEGKTLIELVTGVHHDELNTKPTVPNCMSLYQKFVSHGIRWVPRYNYKLNLNIEHIDCEALIPEIKKHSLFGSMVDLEAVLTKVKIPFILENLKPKTIVYTHYLKDILETLQKAIEQRGWRVAIFSGDDKDGLEAFIEGDADILIASSCVGTGVDRLQYVCNRLIINSLPWTHAEFEQLKGRLYRQGQVSDHVDVFVPLTFANINGEKWSWCESRWKRIQFKKSIADAAVDGVIPEGHLRTPAQAYKDAMLWLERLDRGEIYEIERRKISIPLSSEIQPTVKRKLGDLSQMNQRMNHEPSDRTHARFRSAPHEWECYHSVYREDRKNWPIIPYKEAVEWFRARPHMVIGDFGCGEALLSQELDNQVFSFDHVAINENVVACDVTHVPLDDCSLDGAVFCLSLMGSNFVDYLREARRCLKLDGQLWVAEPSSRIPDDNAFKDLLFRLGFDVSRIEKKWKFTFIKAFKSEREINENALQSLNVYSILQ